MSSKKFRYHALMISRNQFGIWKRSSIDDSRLLRRDSILDEGWVVAVGLFWIRGTRFGFLSFSCLIRPALCILYVPFLFDPFASVMTVRWFQGSWYTWKDDGEEEKSWCSCPRKAPLIHNKIYERTTKATRHFEADNDENEWEWWHVGGDAGHKRSNKWKQRQRLDSLAKEHRSRSSRCTLNSLNWLAKMTSEGISKIT